MSDEQTTQQATEPVKTKEQINQEYNVVCAKIGEAYIKASQVAAQQQGREQQISSLLKEAVKLQEEYKKAAQ